MSAEFGEVVARPGEEFSIESDYMSETRHKGVNNLSVIKCTFEGYGEGNITIFRERDSQVIHIIDTELEETVLSSVEQDNYSRAHIIINIKTDYPNSRPTVFLGYTTTNGRVVSYSGNVTIDDMIYEPDSPAYAIYSWRNEKGENVALGFDPDNSEWLDRVKFLLLRYPHFSERL